MTRSSEHIPVMGMEVQEHLQLKPSDIFVDCTLGMGGHTALVSKQLGKGGRVIAIDRDSESIRLAKENLLDLNSRVDFVQDDFRHIDEILERLNVSGVDGILMDLGISSFQLDDPERGFSFQSDGPLDMRIDQESFISAYDLINSLSEIEISKILKEYGEERWHKRIAHLIVQSRPIQSTQNLRDIILRAVPVQQKRQRIHPATRAFQAFRIVVNRELESLDLALNRCVDFLNPGGKICVISFHSLEDRIVKHKFRDYARQNILKLVTKKPLIPSREESNINPRARSAKMRVAVRI